MRFLIVFALVATSVSCGDKTLEDYQRDKVNKDLAKVQEVSGEYAGQLVSAKDSKPLGGFRVVLTPDTDVITSTLSSEQAKVRIKIIYQGLFQSQIVALKTSFDSEQKTFRATFPVGLLQSLSFSGNLEGDILKGSIASEGYDEDGGRFELKKDAPIPGSENLEISPLQQGKIQKYLSTLTPKNGDEILDVSFAVELSQATTEAQFFHLLVPVKNAQVSFEFLSRKSGKKVDLVFPQAQLDERNGSLLGEAMVGNYRMSMDCRKVDSAWQCRVTSSAQGEVLNTRFEAKP